MSQTGIIPSSQIDKNKWDICIKNSVNDLIYAHTFYLDRMADNWHGIVINDYETVMPVPWRKKFGIRYTYDVPFIQQLGYFSPRQTDLKKILEIFSDFIPYGHYNFNYNNDSIAGMPGVKSTTNYILELADFETIKSSFSTGFVQSLKHTSDHDLTYKECLASESIEMYQQLYKDHLKDITVNDFHNLLLLLEFLQSHNQCIARKIVNKNGDALSTVLLLKDGGRLYNIINATSSEGRKKESNYLLYAQLFSEFAGKGLVCDLEGSELPGVKSFYKKMGAVNQPYFRLHINNLPFPLQLITPSARKMAGD